MADPLLHQASPSELQSRLEVERRGTPFLFFFDAEGRQRIVVLDTEHRRITIGRGKASDVSLEWDSDVSRVHAELEELAGLWTVVDDGLSRNGTFVNGERTRGRRRLVDFDRLQFGATTVTFRAPDVEGAGTTSVAVETAGAAISGAQRRVLVALARPYARDPGFATPATNAQIAAELFLSVAGVKSHLRALGVKFGIQDLPQNRKRARLVELAFQSGEITEHDLT